MQESQRPTLSLDLESDPVDAFVQELQDAIDTGSASHFNRHFAQDVLWGSPFGAVAVGYDQIHAIHTQMFASVVPVKGAARYVVEHARFPTEDVAIAYVRRLSRQPSEPPLPGRPGTFDELALLVLVRREGAWWLAAAQHVPDRRDVYEPALPLEIDVHSVKALLDRRADFLLLDCREQKEFATVRIAGSRLIPMKEIPERLAELEPFRNKRIVVHCHHGGRSARVTQWLRQQGFASAQNMTNGIEAWSLEIDATLPRY